MGNNNVDQSLLDRIVCMHFIRCGQLLQMSHVAWSVCLSVCVLGTRVSCAEKAEPIEMSFGHDSCG